jgi:serine/threonine protein kinase
MEILEKGGFGCIIQPALKHKIKGNNLISKIIKKKGKNNDFKIARILNKYGKKNKIVLDNYFGLVIEEFKVDEDKIKSFINKCGIKVKSPSVQKNNFECGFDCGFSGNYDEVVEHEKCCNKNSKKKKDCSKKKIKEKKVKVNKKTKKKVKYVVFNMEYNGKVIFDYIPQMKQSNLFIKQIMKNVLLGIQILQKNMIIHGDLKPRNILIKDNIARIIDFGGSIRLKKGFKLENVIDNLITAINFIPPEYIFFDLIYGDEEDYNKLTERKTDFNAYLKNYNSKNFHDTLYDECGFDPNILLKGSDGKKEIKKLIKFYGSLKDKKIFDKYKKIYLEKYIIQHDVYSLGKTIEFISLENDFKLDEELMNLVNNMTRLDVRNRYTCIDCLKNI